MRVRLLTRINSALRLVMTAWTRPMVLIRPACVSVPPARFVWWNAIGWFHFGTALSLILLATSILTSISKHILLDLNVLLDSIASSSLILGLSYGWLPPTVRVDINIDDRRSSLSSNLVRIRIRHAIHVDLILMLRNLILATDQILITRWIDHFGRVIEILRMFAFTFRKVGDCGWTQHMPWQRTRLVHLRLYLRRFLYRASFLYPDSLRRDVLGEVHRFLPDRNRLFVKQNSWIRRQNLLRNLLRLLNVVGWCADHLFLLSFNLLMVEFKIKSFFDLVCRRWRLALDLSEDLGHFIALKRCYLGIIVIVLHVLFFIFFVVLLLHFRKIPLAYCSLFHHWLAKHLFRMNNYFFGFWILNELSIVSS